MTKNNKNKSSAENKEAAGKKKSVTAQTSKKKKSNTSDKVSRAQKASAQENGRSPERQLEVKEKNGRAMLGRLAPALLFLSALVFGLLLYAPKLCGAAGYAVKGVLTGLFSVSAMLIPILLLLHAIYFKKDKASGALRYKWIFSLILFVFIDIIFALFTAKEADITASQLYEAGKLFEGGGVVGGFLHNLLVPAIGKVLVGILSSAAVLLFGSFLFGKTPSEMFRAVFPKREKKKNVPVLSKLSETERPSSVVDMRSDDVTEDISEEFKDENIETLLTDTRKAKSKTEPAREKYEVDLEIGETKPEDKLPDENIDKLNLKSQKRPVPEARNARKTDAAVGEETEEKPRTDRAAETLAEAAVKSVFISEEIITGSDAKASAFAPKGERGEEYNTDKDASAKTENPVDGESSVEAENAAMGEGSDKDGSPADFSVLKGDEDVRRLKIKRRGQRDKTEKPIGEQLSDIFNDADDPEVAKKFSSSPDLYDENAAEVSILLKKDGDGIEELDSSDTEEAPIADSESEVTNEDDLAPVGEAIGESEKKITSGLVSESDSVLPYFNITDGADKEEKSTKAQRSERIGSEVTEVPPVPARIPEEPKPPEYRFPPISLLHMSEERPQSALDEQEETANKLVEALKSFGVSTKLRDISHGPTVTRYELQPDIGVRVRSIENLSSDIARALAAKGIRIEAPIPGKETVGIEVPNKIVSIVYIRELIETDGFKKAKNKLTACLGMDVAGAPIYCDISKMPHLLIGGATGMGKSVCINSLILSILYKARPDEVKFIMVDPKKVELSVYTGIPHLLVPVVTDPKKAAGALCWAVNEMERRFTLLEAARVRNITYYNDGIKNDPTREYMPQIVIIIDELADLMMTAKEDVEVSINRLTQKARAAGMHLVVGTQRPSTDVVTGLIKANIPSRIAFTVSSIVDSRVILDTAGADKLLGRGDMLFAPVGDTKKIRVQGAYVSEEEVEAVTDFIKNNGETEYAPDIMESIEKEAAKCGEKKRGGAQSEEKQEGSYSEDEEDLLLYPAIKCAVESNGISTSLLQRRFSIGYSRAAKIIDTMEMMHVVGGPNGSKPRELLISYEAYVDMYNRRKNS